MADLSAVGERRGLVERLEADAREAWAKADAARRELECLEALARQAELHRSAAAPGVHAFTPVVRANRGGEPDGWWPVARAACNPAARLTAGLGLLDRARRRRGVTRGPHPPSSPRRLPYDAAGHVQCGHDMPLFSGRYRYMRTLATGATARTIVCEDLFVARDDASLARAARAGHGGEGSRHRLVVLKVFSAHFLPIGEQESERLRRLNAADPRGEQRVVRQLGRFVLEGRYFVIVLPLLCPLAPAASPAEPMPLPRVRAVGAGVLLGLAFLHAQGVLHADLKPDNVMLELGAGADADAAAPPAERPTLIDFGNACTPAEARAYEADGCLQALPYRAPELLYGLPHASSAIDVWSAGCLLFELASGEQLFAAQSAGQLAVEMAHLLGRPPPALYAAASRIRQLAQHVAPCEPERARPAVALALGRRLLRAGQPRRSAEQLLQLSELIASALDYCPRRRVSAACALCHPFVCALAPFSVLRGAPALPAAPRAPAQPSRAPADAKSDAPGPPPPAAERSQADEGARRPADAEPPAARSAARAPKRARQAAADEGTAGGSSAHGIAEARAAGSRAQAGDGGSSAVSSEAAEAEAEARAEAEAEAEAEAAGGSESGCEDGVAAEAKGAGAAFEARSQPELSSEPQREQQGHERPQLPRRGADARRTSSRPRPAVPKGFYSDAMYTRGSGASDDEG